LTMQCYQPGKSHPLLFGNYFCHSNHWCCNLQPQWSSAKLNQKICSQLKLFASGHIKTLYSEMMSQLSSNVQCAITMNNLDECELTLNCLTQTILQNVTLVCKWQLISTSFIQLSNIWMVLIQLLSTLTSKAMEYMKNELFLDPPPNDLFPLSGQPVTCPPRFHQNLLPDNKKFIAAIRTICRLSKTVLSHCANSFPMLWTQQRNYVSQFASCSFIY
jgi:hypothetical protein